MAKVLVVVKVYPSSADTDLDELVDSIRRRLPEGYDIARSAKEPIAFGLSALKLYVVMPEEVEGGTEELEKLIAGVEGVEELEVEAVHRLSEF